MAIQPTLLFGNDTIAAARVGTSPYGHTFGGPPDRAGTARKDCRGLRIHLLHRLNLTDPAIPLAIPGRRWLPLYYCFDFRVNVLGYRLLSDERLITYFPEEDADVTEDEEWPTENYPELFPQCNIRVARVQYDPTDLEDAYAWAGILGIGKLSQADQAAAKARVANEREEVGLPVPATEEEFQTALSNPFLQGTPEGRCLNPDCSNYRRARQCHTIVRMPAEPVAGVHTFGPWGDGVHLIFQICGACHTICVSNESG